CAGPFRRCLCQADAIILRARYRLASASNENKLRAILGEAAVAYLAIAELAFDDPEHVLDFRTHLAEPAIAGTLLGRQPGSGRGPFLPRPQHACRFGRPLLGAAGVALVAINRGVVSADQTVHHLCIVNAAAGDARRVHKPTFGIDADMRLHAEVPLIPLL